MQALHAKSKTTWNAEPFVARISTLPARPQPYKELEAFLIREHDCAIPHGFRAYFSLSQNVDVHQDMNVAVPSIELPTQLSYLTDGDIVSFNPCQGEIRVFYRRNSRFNSLLIAQQCTNNCIMCSQPPREYEDPQLLTNAMAAIPLMHIDTPELVLTGGEPTLLKEGLLEIIHRCASYLPNTAVLVLSNGRFFTYLSFCVAVKKILHPDLTFGIPLYSDISNDHDFIVQARGAFDQTIAGMMNLARCEQRIELRVVIHRLNYDRLPEIAEFIARNLPFVSHVALMGMEPVGYAKANLNDLWIDPKDYGRLLRDTVLHLNRHCIQTSIYNHQLCVLDPSLWKFARQSISDWKNLFLPQCDTCSVRSSCGGFFSSSQDKHSAGIRPIRHSELLAFPFLSAGQHQHPQLA
jgi:His-Xaa-Ser system radical SAM maturase HxsC